MAAPLKTLAVAGLCLALQVLASEGGDTCAPVGETGQACAAEGAQTGGQLLLQLQGHRSRDVSCLDGVRCPTTTKRRGTTKAASTTRATTRAPAPATTPAQLSATTQTPTSAPAATTRAQSPVTTPAATTRAATTAPPTAQAAALSSCRDGFCSTQVCPGRAEDMWCPNCRGQDFKCMASRAQVALGQDPAFGATYNNFALPNTGFCAMQNYNSPSRSQTMGPKLLTRGLVFSGVGLSQAQFGSGQSIAEFGINGDGSIACGMCLEVKAPIVQWNCELTQVVDRMPTMQKVVVLVMDQCVDSWASWSADGSRPQGNCATGHLDFDVYSADIGMGNMRNVSWRAVDCPVGDLSIEVVFSSGGSPGSGWYFAFHLRDLLVPVAKAEVRCPDGRYAALDYTPNGFGYTGACGQAVSWPALTLRLTSAYGEVVESTLSFNPGSLSRASGNDAIYLPAVSLGTQFRRSLNPPSADANANYRHCQVPQAATA